MARVHTCGHDGCGARIILAGSVQRGQKIPALNAFPDPAGTVAAQHLVSGAWSARFLARDEEPVVPEHRYSVHHCPGSDHAAQRAQWRTAVADTHKAPRNRRGKRAGPQITGVVVQPERLPGMEP